MEHQALCEVGRAIHELPQTLSLNCLYSIYLLVYLQMSHSQELLCGVELYLACSLLHSEVTSSCVIS